MQKQVQQNNEKLNPKEIKGKQEEKPKQEYFSIIRILQTDVPGNKKVLVGLTYIKGVSWGISNALCKILKLDPKKKITDLDKKEIKEIEDFLKNPQNLPKFLKNRRKDFETGKDSHLTGAELDMKKEFDIRRLKKIRSYRGLRHAFGHPTRGQKTRSHFRAKGKKKAIGVKTKKIGKKG